MLFRQPRVILFFLGIAAYVGTEQSLANWMSEYLSVYHGVSPEGAGARSVGLFWGLMSLGCVLGLGLLKLFDSKLVLRVFSILAMATLLIAALGSGEAALVAFPATGFCISVMWSIIFSLALNSVDKHHGSFSGILCTGIIGGALLPLVVGWLGDLVGLRLGMLFVFIPLGYILSIGFWARPLINNATIQTRKEA